MPALWCPGHASVCLDRLLTLCFIIVGLSAGCRKWAKEIIIINYCGFACQAHAYFVATQIAVLITFRKKCQGCSDWWLYQMMKAAAPCQLKLHPERNWDAFSSYYGTVSGRLLKLENESNTSLYIINTVRNICIFQRVTFRKCQRALLVVSVCRLYFWSDANPVKHFMKFMLLGTVLLVSSA